MTASKNYPNFIRTSVANSIPNITITPIYIKALCDFLIRLENCQKIPIKYYDMSYNSGFEISKTLNYPAAFTQIISKYRTYIRPFLYFAANGRQHFVSHSKDIYALCMIWTQIQNCEEMEMFIVQSCLLSFRIYAYRLMKAFWQFAYYFQLMHAYVRIVYGKWWVFIEVRNDSKLLRIKLE